MTKIELQEMLKKHKEWLHDNTKGERANLSGANLSGANLSSADLSRAGLSYADLSGANLSSADLSRAGLSYADLSYAKLHGANLSEANLSSADLSGADLSEANLSEANLSGATGLLSPIDYLEANFKKTTKGYIVYKCFGVHYIPNPNWKIKTKNEVLTEIVNPCRTNDCGCGINVAPLDVVKDQYLNGDIWKCLIEWKWLSGVVVPYNTDGKIRCEKIRLLEVVE